MDKVAICFDDKLAILREVLGEMIKSQHTR